MSVIDLLRSDGSIVVNKKLSHAIGIEPAIMYSELISKQIYFDNRDELTGDGYFFNTVENMQEDTALSKYQQSKSIKKLKELNLIKQSNRGVPQKRYFKVVNDDEKVLQLLGVGQKLKKLTSKSKESEQIEVKKLHSNNTKNNTKSIKKGSEKVSPLLFHQFVLNRQPRPEAVEVVTYYLDYYYDVYGFEHPRLKDEQWQRVVNSLFSVDEYDLSETDLKDMIEQHFTTEYDNCDYNILHFISDGVMLNRMYEVAY